MLLPQLDNRRSRAAFRLRRRIEAADMRIRAEKFADGSLQHAHTVAMHDAHAVDGSKSSGIEKFVDALYGFFRALTNNIQLPIVHIPARTRFKMNIRGQFS